MKIFLFFVLMFDLSSQNKKTIGILALSTKKLTKMIERKYDKEDLDRKYIFEDKYLKNISTFISETYINWLKNVELKIIPIDINAKNRKILEFIENVDGIVLTGGGIDMFEFKNENGIKKQIKSKYLKKIEFIINHVKKINDDGRTFPIWGTCLGFQALLITESKCTLKRIEVDDEVKNVYPIHILGYNSKSIKFFTEEDIFAMENKRIFYFNHKYGFYTKDILKNRYLNDINIVADINLDGHSVAVWVEFKNYPFFGTQFHPEKISDQFIQDYAPFSQRYINQKMAFIFKKYLTGFSGDIRRKNLKVHSVNLYNIGMYKKIIVVDSMK